MRADHIVAESQKVPTGPQSHRHVQDILMEEFRLTASYRIIERLAVDVMIPLRHTMIEATFEDEDGHVIPGFTSIHHRTETLVGLADIVLGTSLLAIKPSTELPLSLTVQVGTTLPTGNIVPDPFKLGAQGLDHQHMFFGTGTINPTVGLHVGFDFEFLRLALTNHARLVFMTNSEGYRPSTTLATDLNVIIPTPVEGLDAVIGAGVFLEGTALWDGKPALNSGRTDVLTAAGVSWDPGEGLTGSLIIKVPVYIEAKGGQLEMPLLIQATIGGRFSLTDEGS